MNYGFVKVASATPKIVVGDCGHNALEICKIMDEVNKKGVQIVVFPELCITGSTCGDLFWQKNLINKAKEKLIAITSYSEGMELVSVVGLPMEKNGKLYNVAAIVYNGEILGIVPKTYITNSKYFASGMGEEDYITIELDEKDDEIVSEMGFDYNSYKNEVDDEYDEEEYDDEYDDEFDFADDVPWGTNLLFKCSYINGLTFAVEIGEDLWAPNSPSTEYALAGATMILNPSADFEVVGKTKYREDLIKMHSAKIISAYISANAGEGESSTDYVFSAHNIIVENGKLLEQSEKFKNQVVYADIDLEILTTERIKNSLFVPKRNRDFEEIEVNLEIENFKLDREIDAMPFIPKDADEIGVRCDEILTMQALALKKRLEHTSCKCAIVGISGGLDSTLTLIATVKAFDMLDISRENIIAVTMPGFGTTDRTYNNAVTMIKAFGCTFKEISIAKSVEEHFALIGHDINNHNVTYENAQARYRTFILMNLANDNNGMVIGTGDMSELALGWATYNGDHMSMYCVNGGIPKTLIRYVVKNYAQNSKDIKLKAALLDVVDTPVSPELLPADNGKIAQKTEDLVGPYELHDFFLYYALRYGFKPEKVLFMAKTAFKDTYDEETIEKWLKTFYRRFFSQQYKRSCLPDGPKIGTVGLSPRGDLAMPSDASAREWLE